MPAKGNVLGVALTSLAQELAEVYLAGELAIVAGAGVSRASGLPGWDEMVASIERDAARDLVSKVEPAGLQAVLTSLHREDPISRADSLQRLLTTGPFHRHLHEALYGPIGAVYRPSVAHWHIASLIDRHLMPDVFTSNYDDLLEDAKKALGRSGRVRHFHGRLPQKWTGTTRLSDPPVVTSRDYMAAEERKRYDRLAGALQDKTVLLVGFSLSDPNLARIIRSQARDCRAILVASPANLSRGEQALRLDLLRRYWHGLKIDVTAIEAHEELPAFLLALRREIGIRQGQRLPQVGEDALVKSVIQSPFGWTGARDWRSRLRGAVAVAKTVAPAVSGDTSLRAGFYGIEASGDLVHLVSSAQSQRGFRTQPRRRLLADDPRPWGAAGYAFASGAQIASPASGAAFDRNVPEVQLLAWQGERAVQKRLPASAVLCTPAWIRYRRSLVCIGILYFSSRRGAAFERLDDDDELRFVLQYTLAAMIRPERVIEGGMA